jgi:integrase
MGVHKEKYRDPKTGAVVREFYRVDFVYKHPDGRRQRIREISPVNTRRGAEEHERQLRAALQSGTYKKEEEPPAPTLEEMAKLYLDIYAPARLKPSTLHDKRLRLDRHILPRYGKRPITDLGIEVKDEIATRLKKAGLGAVSINNTLGALGSILRYAVRVGKLDKAPPCGFVPVAPTDYDYLSFEELPRLYDAARRDPAWFGAIVAAGDAGLRLGELNALAWEEIDFPARMITVTQAYWRDELGSPKWGKGRRIPMTERLTRALQSLRHLRGPFVFCDAAGVSLSQSGFEKALDRYAARAGLRSIGWHVLRHTFCSHLAARGASAKAIQELAGHSDLKTTMRYMHLAPSQLKDSIRLLEGVGPTNDQGREQ